MLRLKVSHLFVYLKESNVYLDKKARILPQSYPFIALKFAESRVCPGVTVFVCVQ